MMLNSKKEKNNCFIFIICAIFIFISLFSFFLLKRFDWFQKYSLNANDSQSYRNAAANLLNSGFFSQDGINPDYFRTPGYPIFLSIIYFFGGTDITVIIIQTIMAAITIYLFYNLILLLCDNQKLAFWGTCVILLDLIFYQYPWAIYSEPLFNFLVFLSLFFLALFIKKPQKIRYFVGFTLALNLALLTRPILSYFNAILCAVLLIFAIKKLIPWKCFIMFLIAFLLVYVGWSLRNYYHSGVFVFSTVRNHNLLTYDSAFTKSMIDHEPFEASQEFFRNQFNTAYPQSFLNSLNDAQYMQLTGKMGSEYLSQHFGSYLLLNIQGLFKTLLGPSKSFFFELIPNQFIALIICAAYMLYLLIVYIVYVLGLIFNYKKNRFLQVYIFIISGYLAAASASVGYNRFRSPFFLLILLSAVINCPVVFTKIKSKIKNQKTKRKDSV